MVTGNNDAARERVAYGGQSLSAALGSDYDLLSSWLVRHEAPSGAAQQFLYAHLRRR
jgi:hypothetical protein